MPNQDTDIQKANQRKHYQNNKQRYKDWITKRRTEIRKWLTEYRVSKGCSECGENHPAVLDFHHEGDKDLPLASAVSKQWSQKRLEAEVAKCRVLCSNCHRKHHWNQGESGRKPISRLDKTGVEEDG